VIKKPKQRVELKITGHRKAESQIKATHEALRESEERLRYEKKKLQTLLDISSGLYSINSFKDIGRVISDILVDYKLGESIGIKLAVYDSEEDLYQVVFFTGETIEEIKNIFQYTVKPCSLNDVMYYSKIAIQQKKMLLITDNHSEYSLSIDLNQKYLERSAMVFIPLFNKDQLIGLFSFARSPANSLDQDLIEVLESIGSYSGMAINQLLKDKKRKKLEQQITESEKRYHSLFYYMIEGLAYCRMIFENEKPMDFVYLEVNNSFEKLTGLKNVIGKRVTEVIPGIKETNPELFEIYGRVSLSGIPESFNVFLDTLKMWLSISVYSPVKEFFVTVFDNITERRQVEIQKEKALKALETSEKKYRKLHESLMDGFVYVNMQGFIIDSNEFYQRMVGYSSEELVNLKYRDLTPEKWHAYEQKIVEDQILQRGYSDVYEKEYLCKSGNIIPIELRTFLIKDDEGNYEGMWAIVRDISERKQVENDLLLSKQHSEVLLRTLQGIINSTDDLIFSLDTNYNYTSFNQNHESLMKKIYGVDIKIGDNILDCMLVQADRNEAKKNIDCALKGERIIGESYSGYELLARIYFEVTHNSIKDSNGNIVGVAVFGKDITERKLAEDLIRKLNVELEQRVIERTAKLETANKDLEAFSYSVSHDLRAPLRAINGFSQILVNRYIDKLNDEGRHYFENIIEASDRMSRLIDDILKYSRLGRKSLSFSPVSLKELFDRVILDYEEIIFVNKIEIIITEDLPEIESDYSLLSMILSNLINNAIKYHRKNVPGIIEIDFEQNDAWYIIRVKDNGIGIDTQYQKIIFNMFQRLHSEDEYPGTGIGLAIVKKCSELLEGEVRLESSELNVGSTFLVKLPKE
jgi:PAS domain S-box-containing protein